jgi:hypothetical protein
MEGIKMNPGKITAVQDGEAAQNLKDIHAVLGFSNFYHHVIWNCSKIVQPLTLLT